MKKDDLLIPFFICFISHLFSHGRVCRDVRFVNDHTICTNGKWSSYTFLYYTLLKLSLNLTSQCIMKCKLIDPLNKWILKEYQWHTVVDIRILFLSVLTLILYWINQNINKLILYIYVTIWCYILSYYVLHIYEVSYFGVPQGQAFLRLFGTSLH